MFKNENPLEYFFIDKLKELGYEYIGSKLTVEELTVRFFEKLSTLQNEPLTEEDIKLIKLEINKKNTVFKKALLLRQGLLIKTGTSSKKVIFFDKKNIERNSFEVVNQVVFKKTDTINNYSDVTLLINGLPLFHIELKRGNVVDGDNRSHLTEAFNQINRYKRDIFKGTIYDFVQVFIVSNEASTLYFSNNNQTLDSKFSFKFTDKDNVKINTLEEFTEVFLNRPFVIDLVNKYMALDTENKVIKVLRPYQIHAISALLDRVDNYDQNRALENRGFIWHTTGSGKTITSFKAAEILSTYDEIKKVFFIVDRIDLNDQTYEEYTNNNIKDIGVSCPENYTLLYDDIKNNQVNVIVTTLQKMGKLIADINSGKNKYDKSILNQRYVMIFDECHRSLYGDNGGKSIDKAYFDRIVDAFTSAQYFGFTGTPLFSNTTRGTTTLDIFSNILHKYLINNAIEDHNVLPFDLTYIGPSRREDQADLSNLIEISDTELDQDLYDQWRNHSSKYFEQVAHEIISTIDKYTINRKYHAMFATNSVDNAIKFYRLLSDPHFYEGKSIKPLNVATIFTTLQNDDSYSNTDGQNVENTGDSKPTNDQYDEIIKSYNEKFSTDESILNFNVSHAKAYVKDVKKRLKDGEIDLLIIVNMLLTGFDDPNLNTFYYERNLKSHNLVQAYSRTNRLAGADKQVGHIISFNNDKEEVEEAFRTFSSDNESCYFSKQNFKELRDAFTEAFGELKEKFPNTKDVDLARSDRKDMLLFLTTMREVLSKYNKLIQCRDLKRSADGKIEGVPIFDPDYFAFCKTIYFDEYQTQQSIKTTNQQEQEDFNFRIELLGSFLIDSQYLENLVLDGIETDEANEEEFRDTIQNSALNYDQKVLILDWFDDTKYRTKESWNDFLATKKFEEYERLARENNIDSDQLFNVIQTTPIYESKTKSIRNLLTERNVVERITLSFKINQQIQNIEMKYNNLMLNFV